MNNKIEDIIKELYEIDPTLREHKNRLRELVGVLLSSKPRVLIDGNFIKKLKEKIVAGERAERGNSRRGLQSEYSWWAFRFTPVGALAVLLLFAAVRLDSPVSERALMNAPSLKQDFAQSETYSIARDSSENQSENSIGISTQKPGWIAELDYISASEAGYVVISSSDNPTPGNIMGASGIITSGTTGRTEIKLYRAMKNGGEYFATLFKDDGDGVFNFSKDLPVTDEITGRAVSVRFETRRDVGKDL